MISWDQFSTLQPRLTRIEEAYAQLELFEKHYRTDDASHHGLTPEDIREVKQETMMALKAEISALPGRVYYWLLPFYKGDFLVLLRAFKALSTYDPEAHTTEAKRAFYQFFLSLPFPERIILGIQLDSVDLVNRTTDLLERIESKKQEFKEQLNQNYSN